MHGARAALGHRDRAAGAEVLASSVEAVVCTLERAKLGEEWIGRRFDEPFLDMLRASDIVPCGEHGEFHTVVLDAPVFSQRLLLDETRVGLSDHHAHLIVERWRAVDRREPESGS